MTQPVDFTSLAVWGRLAGRAFKRSWGRDVMLYTGGVSFFALLAVFPAIAILIGFYKIVLSSGQATEQAAALAEMLPAAASGIFVNEVERMTGLSARSISTQSAIALIIGAYAAHRGFKALLAGLNLIHDEPDPHGFFRFNLLALIVALLAFALFTVVSGAVVTSRILSHASETGSSLWLDGVWSTAGLFVGLTCLYRYAMVHSSRVAWRAAIAGGVVATALSATVSWLCVVYVEQIVELGATYGSVGAVVVLLIWLSWNVNAIFYGGGFATEMEIVLRRMEEPPTEDAPEVDTDSRIVSLQSRRRAQP